MKKGLLAYGFQLATLVDAVPPGDDWVYEVKFDGYRIQARLQNKQVSLITRNNQDYTEKFQIVGKEISKLKATSVVLDGEVVVQDAKGKTNFQSLQNALSSGNKSSAVYFAFDLLHLDGKDLTGLPLLERKEKLKKLLKSAHGKKLQYSTHWDGNGEPFFGEACNTGLEGIICKQKNALYKPRRTSDWVKVKCHKRQELVIGGYTPSTNASYPFGALLIGYHRDGKLLYAGKVGTGFTNTSRQELIKKFKKIIAKENPFSNKVPTAERKKATWIKPVLVGEVEFTEWTESGSIRHPSFKGLRDDKKASQVIREIEVHTPKRQKKKK